MAVIKCKMCGGDLNITEGLSVAECEYCGSKQTIPSADNEKKLTLFNRASRLLRNCEFDKAAGVFESIVADFPEEAEAYWCLVLCKYGIEYVDDPATGKKVPTCHRSSFESVLDDPNFEQACEYNDAIARRIYRDEARQIEELRKRIIEVSGREEPYDIFISYKETDDSGERTLDSVIAQDIYNELTEKGYRVFFSRISLEDKLGVEYEPYIFAALNSAKLMLVVGTDYEHFDAVWVKNEWSRFLKLIASGQKKVLIPVFKNMDAYDMPKEFAKLAAQDMGKVGAMQDLVRGIEKIIGSKKEEPKETVVVRETSGGPNVSALIKRGEMALQDGNWQDAKGYFDRVLDMDAECAEAYLGLFLVEEKCADANAFVRKRFKALETCEAETLTACPEDTARVDSAVKKYSVPGYFEEKNVWALYYFDRTYMSSLKGRQKQLEAEKQYFAANKNLSRAEKFAAGETKTRVFEMKNGILSHAQRLLDLAKSYHLSKPAELRAAYAKHLDEADIKAKQRYEKALCDKKDDIYNKAYGLMGSGNEAKILEAKKLFESIPGWKAADELAVSCTEKAETSRKDAVYNKACGLMVSDDETKGLEAKRLFETIPGWKDADKRAEDCIEKVETARKNAIYSKASGLKGTQDEAKILEAKRLFETIPGWRKADKFALECAEKIEHITKEKERKRIADEKAKEAKKRKRKITAIILAVLVAIAAGAYLFLTIYFIPAHKYAEAEYLFASGDYSGAIATFTELGEYKDATAKIMECQYAEAMALFETGNYSEAATIFSALGDYEDAALKMLECQYAEAMALFETGNYSEAATIFSALGEYEDATAKIMECQYAEAMALFETGNYSEAAAIFSNLGDYENAKEKELESRYNKANSYYTSGNYAKAAIAFSKISAYGDAKELCLSSWKKAGEAGNWDTVCAYYHTIGLKSDGTAVAVGYNGDGECNVSDWKDIVDISSYYDHTLGLKSDGTVVAVGSNVFTTCDVSDWKDIVDISTGYYFTAGLKRNGTVVVTGYSGTGDLMVSQQKVSSWRNIVSISAGFDHIVGLKSDGTVVATGENDKGECAVSTWIDIVAISTKNDHTVGLKSDGTVVAVGDNSYGQCNVSGWSDIVAISAGEYHTVGLKRDGTVVATGSNTDGQCNVSGWKNIVSISAGKNHTVGLKSDGTVVAVGKNSYGQCNVGGWTNIKVPET